MKKYYEVAFTEAFTLIANDRVLFASLHCLFAALVCLPFYVLFQLSLAVAMLPLYVTGSVRRRFAGKTLERDQ